MILRHNISSGVSNSLLLSFIVKFEWNSAVILLWDNTEKKMINNTLSNSGMEYIHDDI